MVQVSNVKIIVSLNNLNRKVVEINFQVIKFGNF